MSKLHSPWVGPIIGHATENSARIWIRAKAPDDQGVIPSSNSRTIGVITVLDAAGKPDPDQTYYFRLRREFDRTGTFLLGTEVNADSLQNSQAVSAIEVNPRLSPLIPNTTYYIRVGVLIVDDGFDDNVIVNDGALFKHLPPPSAWSDALMELPEQECCASFRTFPQFPQSRLSFLMGSCRYPGLLFKAKKSDAIFAPMQRKIGNQNSESPVRFVLMTGDQIYADLLNRVIPIGRADSYKEFQDRYIEAFGSPNLRKLLSSIPHYMILDDHEIEDNWTQDRINKAETRALFNLAMGAYMSYQWSHGPRSYDRNLFYHFDCGGFPFFVLDTRTQRFRDDVMDDLADNHLLGRPSINPSDYPSQLDHLCNWLIKQQKEKNNSPKFIVTPSVFVPNEIATVKSDQHKNTSDSWAAFPSTRRRLLDTLVEHRIQNVVFLSGDIHCSCIAELQFKGSEAAESLKAFSITSSAFYWPFPFADGNPSDFVHDSAKQGDTFYLSNSRFALNKLRMDYIASHFCQDDNFCQIDLDYEKHELTVQFFGKNGEPLKTRNTNGVENLMIKTLRLA